MSRFRFDKVAAGAALQQAQKARPDAEIAKVEVDDHKVKVDSAKDAFTKALERVHDDVSLGETKAPPTAPTRDQFDSDAAFHTALDRWERGQTWKAYKAQASAGLQRVSKAGGTLLRRTGITAAAGFAGR